MNTVQRVIKYVAMAFGGLLAVGIICAIIGGIAALANGVSGGRAFSGERKSFTETYENVRSLDIESYYNQVNIKTDKTLNSTGRVRVDFNNVSSRYKERMNGDVLKLYGEGNGFWNLFGLWDDDDDRGTVDIWLPEEFAAERLILDGGVGDLYAENIRTGRLEIDAGVGSVTIQNINAEKTDIDGGVGEITLSEVLVGECDIDGGMGNIKIDGRMDGDANIDGGMGNIVLRLEDSSRDFNIKTDTGMGDIRINDRSYSEGTQYNENASYKLDIDGGMGNVTIYFEGDLE